MSGNDLAIERLRACLVRLPTQTLHADEAFEHEDGFMMSTIGFHPGPHYEETVAEFTDMNRSTDELVAMVEFVTVAFNAMPALLDEIAELRAAKATLTPERRAQIESDRTLVTNITGLIRNAEHRLEQIRDTKGDEHGAGV